MTAPLSGSELNRAAIHAALVALREGRTTGTPALDHVGIALGRARARAWARLRSACPDLSEAEIDFAADRTVDVIASVPVLVVLLVIADAARGADAGGAS